ncbi:MAG: hypothetical protein ACRDA4_05915 [Filifactoraceae bacterium]
MDDENIDANIEDEKVIKKTTRYKKSRVLIVISGVLIALAMVLFAGEMLIKTMFSSESQDNIAERYKTEIALAKTSLGENIIYVPSLFKDVDGKKYKGVAFLSETDLMFIGEDGFEKTMNIDFFQDVAINADGNKYEVAITYEDGNIYKISKIKKTADAEGFIAILSR